MVGCKFDFYNCILYNPYYLPNITQKIALHLAGSRSMWHAPLSIIFCFQSTCSKLICIIILLYYIITVVFRVLFMNNEERGMIVSIIEILTV